MTRLQLAWAALALSLVPQAFAQEPTGALYGTVSDQEGGRLPGAAVDLEGIGAPRLQVADERGEFRFLGLDPGDYALRATLDGFSTVEHPRINIRIARSTTVEVILTPAFAEVISVAAESPLLDLRQLERGTHVTRTELDAMPTSRDPWAIVAQTPGVLVDRVAVGGNRGEQAIFAAMGSGFQQNDFLLDGVQITDMAAGGSATYYDFDQFEEVQLATGGSDVTKIAGGVSVNLVTRRGTNEPRGSARYLLTDEELQSSPDLDPEDFPPGQEPGITTDRLDRLEDYGFELGGPLRRDRVWLWGAAARNEIDEIATGGLPSATRIENLALKANGQLTGANSALATWNWSEKTVLGRGAGPDRQGETTWDQQGETTIVKIEDTHVLGARAVVTGGYSDVDIGFGFFARGGSGPGAPEALRDVDGVWKHNFATFETPRRAREAKLEGSLFLHGGEVAHELELGARRRTWDDINLTSWPGRDVFHIAGVNFGLPDGPQDIVVAHRGGSNPTSEEFRSLWAQDTLVAGRWTLNLGLRYDHQQGENEPSSVAANAGFPEVLPALEFPGNDGGGFEWETISPRLGATYAVGESAQTLLRASLARFPEALGSDEILRVNPMLDAYAFFRFTDGDADNQWDGPQEPATLLFPAGFDPADPTALVSPNATDPALDPALTDELVLGIEHAVRPELVVALHLTYRRISDIAERRRFVRDASGEVRLARREDYVEDTVLTGILPDGTPFAVPVFALAPGLALTGGSLLTTGDREIEARGVALSAAKRLSGRWMLRGFLNWFDTEWSIPESFFAFDDPTDLHPSVSADDDGQPLLESLFRFQDVFLDSRWQAHLSGLYQVAPERPWGFDLAANLQARDGYPLPYHLRVVSAIDGELRFVQAVEQVDDFRTDDLVTLDLRLAKEVPLPGDRL
ncbi:MAG: TonB-dependent receptor, partial [Thermoanaerobaculia bacterium]